MTTSRKLDATPRARATLPLALPRQDPTAAEATAGTHNRVASENLEGRRRRGSAKYKRVCSGEKDRAAYRSAAAHAYTGAAPQSGDSSLSSNSAVTRTRVSKVTTTRRRLQHTTQRDASWAISLPRGKKKKMKSPPKHRHTRTLVSLGYEATQTYPLEARCADTEPLRVEDRRCRLRSPEPRRSTAELHATRLRRAFSRKTRRRRAAVADDSDPAPAETRQANPKARRRTEVALR